ncbi:MAG: hypothetical protein PHX78_10185 [bacterium]|nr:hypothetical protein [bacterium]
MMKRLGLFLFAVLFIAAISSGCDNFKGEKGDNVVSGEFNKTGTLQGFIFDAVTGSRLGGNDLLKMRLYQGSDRRDPDVLVTDTNDRDYGFYAYNNIPFNLYAGNIIYQLVVTRDGYQDFKGNVTPNALSVNTFADKTDSMRVDGKYNMLGNIYLFPTGTTAGSVTVKVTDPFARVVSGATVRLQQNITGSTPIAETGNRLLASAGLMPNVSATTDSAGIATFADSTLVLGGQYTVTVDPLTFQGQQLGGAAGASFIIGTNKVDQTIALANLDPNLYVNIASNSVPGTIDSTGVLTLTFNQAVSLTTGFESTFVGTLSGASGAVFDTAAASNVTAALSNSNLTLTLTPHFSTYATAAGATITYTYPGTIYITSTQTAGPAFTALADKYGNVISRIVQLKTR